MKYVLMLSIFVLFGCATTRPQEPPYKWQTIEGFKEARQCVSQCPTPTSCSLAYLDFCVSSARQIDQMYADMKKAP